MTGVREFAVTDSQRAIWMLQRLQPELRFFHVGMAATVDGALEANLFEQAFAALVERHETLRTTFSAVDGQLVQRIHEERDVPVEWISADGVNDADLRDRMIRDCREPYDLERDTPMRPRVYRRGSDSVVLLRSHHIAQDQRSGSLLLDELEEIYAGLHSGVSPSFEPVAPQFREYSEWLNARVEGEQGKRCEEYWKKCLAGDSPDLALPLDHARPSRLVYQGASVPFELPAGLMGRLEEVARSAGLTLNAVLLTGYFVLLHRYSGDSTITVGTYSSGRSRREFRGIAGLVSNPIPLRIALAPDLAFVELAGQVSRLLRGAFRHQNYPLNRMAEHLDGPHDPSRSPIFQAAFNFDRQAPKRPAGAWRQEPWLGLLLQIQEGQFELKLVAAQRQDGCLQAVLQYQPALQERATIERFALALRALLEGAARDGSRSVADLPMLDRQEEHRILVEWNRTERDYRRDAGVHELVREQIERTPQALAVCHGGEAITYAELGRRVARLARQLAAAGAGPESIVGVCLDPSIRQVTALLAVLETGAAYLPLDPSHPSVRRRSMLDDSGARLLIQDGDSRVDPEGPRVVSLDRLAPASEEEADATPTPAAGGARRAYVLFTSGSTGKPKGVEISHRSLVNLLEGIQERVLIGPSDVWLSITTLSFDIAALEIFLPLVRGARLAMADRDVAGNGSRLADEIERHGATVVQATPTSWRLLSSAQRTKRPLTRLCGGEALSRSLADRLLSEPGSLWNLYGPTETTIWSTAERVGPGRTAPAIGRPLANAQVYVLDAGMRPVPIGVVGELWIGGDGVALGYLGRPELTAQRFVPDPFRPAPEARLYRTGDLVRWRDSGELEFVGRTDDQVKVRGIRIELGEIEAALLEQPGVAEAVVTTRGAQDTEARLAAYLVPTPGRRPDAVSLRQRLRERLPDYMVPASFTLLDAMPLTPNRKINRRALPDPAPEPVTRARFVAARNSIELGLAGMFAKVLGVERIGIDDDFFELGGASIASLELAALAEKQGIAFAPEAVFEHRTVRALAASLRVERDASNRRSEAMGREESRLGRLLETR